MTHTLGIAAAVVGGVGVAAQSKVNGALGTHLHDGYLAALISLLVGLVLIGAIVVVQASARGGLVDVIDAVRSGRLRAWQCLGGVFGALVVTSQGLSVTALGVALFTVAIVAGQTTASLAVDRAGLGPAGPQPLTGPRIAGSALTVVAVVIAVADRFGAPSTLLLAILPAIAGAGSAVQQAINGQVRVVAASVPTATLVNFIVATTVLAIAVGVDVGVRGWPTGTYPRQLWYYTGGLFGVLFIAIAAAVVEKIGVLLLGLGMVAGQLVGAVAIDFAVPGGAGRPPLNTLAGVALTLVAVGIAAARPGKRAPS